MQPGPPPQPPPYFYAPHPPPKSGISTAVIVLCCVIGGVFVLGVLAAVAIPAFLDYQHKHKSSEAELNLDLIYRGLKGYAIEQGQLPTESAPLTPAIACCDQPGHQCMPDPQDWEAPPWQEIDFEIDTVSKYQYRYTVDGDTVVIEAVGDLDCDGESSSYTLTAKLVGGVLHKGALLRPDHVD